MLAWLPAEPDQSRMAASSRCPRAQRYGSATGVQAVFDVDVEDPFEQPRPAHERCLSLRVSVLT